MSKLVEIWENVVARVVITAMCYCSGLMLYFILQMILK